MARAMKNKMTTRDPKRRIAALDIGSSKMCCFIADIDETGDIHIAGIGHHLSFGIKSGAVTDLGLAERAVRAVVTQAEDMAGQNIDAVAVATTAGNPRSELLSVEVSVAGHAVERADIAHVARVAQRRVDPAGQALLHVLPTCYSVDDACGIVNPEGMYGEKLGLDIHLITADPGPILNLESVLNRGHLNVSGAVAAPYAAGLACLHDQEKQLGAACVDMGGATTGISVFFGGAMVDCGVLPMGGQMLSLDLAKALGISIGDAERLKTLYGSAIQCDADKREHVDITPLADSPGNMAHQAVQRAHIVEILRPRLEEFFELIGEQLSRCGFTGADAGTVVLAGGASQLPGLQYLGEHILAMPVRPGYPVRLRGLAEATSGPAFAAAVGVLLHGAQHGEDIFSHADNTARGESDWPERIVQWLREAF